jgi:hypothetical protein
MAAVTLAEVPAGGAAGGAPGGGGAGRRHDAVAASSAAEVQSQIRMSLHAKMAQA